MPTDHPFRQSEVGASRSELDRIRAAASRFAFEPKGAVRCDGDPMFRSRPARDAACLADLDPTVEGWSCLPLILKHGRHVHVPDLLFAYGCGCAVLVDVVGAASPLPDWVPDAAGQAGYGHRLLTSETMAQGWRLENARELLRYHRWRVSLSNRVRLLSALDENGSLPVRACLDVLATRDAIASIASLALRRFIEIEIDEAPIGPESSVRRTHRS